MPKWHYQKSNVTYQSGNKAWCGDTASSTISLQSVDYTKVCQAQSQSETANGTITLQSVDYTKVCQSQSQSETANGTITIQSLTYA
jgi:hypothetical protein